MTSIGSTKNNIHPAAANSAANLFELLGVDGGANGRPVIRTLEASATSATSTPLDGKGAAAAPIKRISRTQKETTIGKDFDWKEFPVRMSMRIDAPKTPGSECKAVHFKWTGGTSHTKGPFLSYTTKDENYRALGFTADLISSGEVDYYVDPFEEMVWIYGTFGPHKYSFSSMRWDFLHYYKRKGSPEIKEWASGLIKAIKNKDPVWLDKKDMMFKTRTNTRVAVYPKKKGKAKTSDDGFTNVVNGAAPKIVSKYTAGVAVATTSHEDSSTTEHSVGPFGPEYFSIERGHGIKPIYDGEKYTFTESGVPISKNQLKKAGIRFLPTPCGQIILGEQKETETQDDFTNRKLQLYRDAAHYMLKTTKDITAQALIKEKWNTIFVVKSKETGKWIFVKELGNKSIAEKESAPVEDSVEAPIVEKETAPVFNYAAAIKKKKKVIVEPDPEPEPEIKPENTTELFPALPSMTPENKAKQQAIKEAYYKKVEEEASDSATENVALEDEMVTKVSSDQIIMEPESNDFTPVSKKKKKNRSKGQVIDLATLGIGFE